MQNHRLVQTLNNQVCFYILNFLLKLYDLKLYLNLTYKNTYLLVLLFEIL